jgi:cytochrome o ubiquinol oxidase subunit 1
MSAPQDQINSPWIGRLSLDALPFLHDPVVGVTFVGVVLGGIALLFLLTKYRLWGYLWKEWFTSIDHKKIGIMYCILAIVMLLRGFSDAVLMRRAAARASCPRTTTIRSSPRTA